MSGKIFISYRRDDSRYQARMIYEAFLRRMPRENVFMDIDTIPLGVNFVKVLEGWVEQCEVLLVLMGPDWANSTDPKTGKRRLDNPKDFVRVEIRGALTRDIPVVPVMLDGAEIPDEAQLPDDIKGLLNRNAEFVEYRTFDGDVQRLLKKLGVGVNAKQTAAPATIAGTLRDQITDERSTRSSAEDIETQGDLVDKARERKTLGKEWTRRWLTPMVGLAVLLAAAVIGALVFWSPGPISGKKADVAAVSLDRGRQAAEAQVADAEKARQAAEAKAAEATAAVVKSEQARQAAEAQAADAEKARQVAAAKAADAEKARQTAETKAADAEKARQAASKTADDAEKARQAATAKAAEADKARQAAEAKAAEATDAAAKSAQARQAAEVHAAEADKARQAAEAKVAVTVTSGPASPSGQFSRRSNIEVRGGGASESGTIASVGDCERICSQSNTCKVYTYSKTDKWCYTYSADMFSGAETVRNADYETGIRK
jgi:TIR domain/PAN domain